VASQGYRQQGQASQVPAESGEGIERPGRHCATI
jgi:hypothetical protein